MVEKLEVTENKQKRVRSDEKMTESDQNFCQRGQRDERCQKKVPKWLRLVKKMIENCPKWPEFVFEI